jgi:Heterokaryon incompatibility protein (HET)
VGLSLGELTKFWIQNCISHHRLCLPSKDAPLPTRVLDVGSINGPLDQIRLIVTNGITGKWTALSYFWGGTNHLRTTSKTLKKHLQQIPLFGLPKTIQDAVLVTRQLGIQYLWVDSLCIIQDSDIDWQAEAGKMMEVYRNFYITIAANSGLDAQTGLFLDRNLLQSRPCKLEFQSGSGRPVARWVNPPRASWAGIIRNGSLQTRGWTLQETMLAVRVVYYDEKSLYWQCREGVRQERAPAYLITANDPLVPRRMFDAYLDDPMNIFTLWCDLVQDFTSRTLERESDKLVAISGLASVLSTYIQSRSQRRLASKEEKRLYSAPRWPKHWAVPKSASRWGRLAHLGGGNIGMQHMFIQEELSAGRPIYTHTRGPISIDPFLALRYLGELDPSSTRTIQIMQKVGLGPLLEFVAQKDNLDFNYEYVILLSHPYTHKAYQEAYYIWKPEKDGKSQPNRMQEKANTEPEVPSFDSQKGEGEVSDDSEPSDLSEMYNTYDEGLLLDPGTETVMERSHRTNIYVYGDDCPMKAIMEWPSYSMDSQYTAGLWRADILYGLRWYCQRPGRRAARFRAPSWSWASLDDTRIIYDHPGRLSPYTRKEGYNWSSEWHATLLDVTAIPRGPNPFGDVKSSKLTLLAPLRQLPFYPNTTNLQPTTKEGNHSPTIPESDPLTTALQSLTLDEESRSLDPSMKILRLDTNTCIILEPVPGISEPGRFRRVGYWTRSGFGGGKGDVKSHGIDGLDGWESKVVILI